MEIAMKANNKNYISTWSLLINETDILKNKLIEQNASVFLPSYVVKCKILTEREHEIAQFVIQGKTAKETAKLLELSYRTVERHLDNIKLKLNCVKKSELVVKLLKEGLCKY